MASLCSEVSANGLFIYPSGPIVSQVVPRHHKNLIRFVFMQYRKIAAVRRQRSYSRWFYELPVKTEPLSDTALNNFWGIYVQTVKILKSKEHTKKVQEDSQDEETLEERTETEVDSEESSKSSGKKQIELRALPVIPYTFCLVLLAILRNWHSDEIFHQFDGQRSSIPKRILDNLSSIGRESFNFPDETILEYQKTFHTFTDRCLTAALGELVPSQIVRVSKNDKAFCFTLFLLWSQSVIIQYSNNSRSIGRAKISMTDLLGASRNSLLSVMGGGSADYVVGSIEKLISCSWFAERGRFPSTSGKGVCPSMLRGTDRLIYSTTKPTVYRRRIIADDKNLYDRVLEVKKIHGGYI